MLFCLLGAALIAVPVRVVFSDEIADRSTMAKAIAHHIMGSTCEFYGLTVQAVGEYQQATTYDPKSYLTRLRLGTNLARMGRFDDAIKQLVLIPALNPKDIQSHYLLALIYSSQKKIDNSAAEYEIILKSLATESPENIDVYFYLGQLYYARHDYAKAIEQFKRVLALQPQNAEMMYFLGSLYVEIDREDQAIDIFKKALAVDPSHDGVLNSLGYIYAEQGNNLEEAMRLVKRALAILPDSAAYLDSLGWVYFKQGRYDDALKALLKADAKEHDPVIFGHLGDVCLALRHSDEAKKYWKKSIELNPDQKSVLDKIERLEKSQAGNVISNLPNTGGREGLQKNISLNP